MTDRSADARPTGYRRGLHLFAWLTVITTFILIAFGGTVTSKGVGMAVPDWPRTYGYNMFLFPPSLWKGGIFWEHTHRLLGSLVGVLSIVLMVWLIVTQRNRPWLRWTGVGALALVIVQGVMGGLRVTEDSAAFAVVHGINGQLVLCLFVLIAAATSPWWLRARQEPLELPSAALRKARRLAAATMIVVVVQLVLGAVMRHNNAGLAIPDFPTSFGGVLPPMSQQAIIDATNRMILAAQSPDSAGYEDFVDQYATPMQVHVHFAHRLWAVVVVVHILLLLRRLSPVAQRIDAVRRAGLLLLVLLLVQVGLGISVIWTGRHPEVATAHQTTGAVLLAVLVWLGLRAAVLRPAESPHATADVGLLESAVASPRPSTP